MSDRTLKKGDRVHCTLTPDMPGTVIRVFKSGAVDVAWDAGWSKRMRKRSVLVREDDLWKYKELPVHREGAS